MSSSWPGDQTPSDAGYATGSTAAPGYAEHDQSAHEKAQSASLGDIVGDISSGLSTLMRQEVALAKAEAKQSATRAGKGAGMLAGAGLAGFFVLLFLSIAVWEWLSSALNSRGWAAILVMVVWAVIAAILASVGRKHLKQIQGMPRTVETAKQVPDALKGNEDHS